ncbi:hypothetical protein BDZ90DRAFT_55019 [Jaminaea rosea]|uniref:Uncharacterized protein n=1 Tax=Jaminaea rosea TaxID=1569628 RepID=A0A316UL50_9BASI|nr:hypothetical protein BDZ90DRAFT_55019 [Jaminaea rosea]PWN25969.1 hypothetical protein BDZ90DRAFT_55019 [Jaminaea rosea]
MSDLRAQPGSRQQASKQAVREGESAARGALQPLPSALAPHSTSLSKKIWRSGARLPFPTRPSTPSLLYHHYPPNTTTTTTTTPPHSSTRPKFLSHPNLPRLNLHQPPPRQPPPFWVSVATHTPPPSSPLPCPFHLCAPCDIALGLEDGRLIHLTLV